MVGIYCSGCVSGQDILVTVHATRNGGQERDCFTGKKHGARRKLPKHKDTLRGSVRASIGSQSACDQASQVTGRLVKSDMTGNAINEPT